MPRVDINCTLVDSSVAKKRRKEEKHKGYTQHRQVFIATRVVLRRKCFLSLFFLLKSLMQGKTRASTDRED